MFVLGPIADADCPPFFPLAALYLSVSALVSFDPEVRKRPCRTIMRTSESQHWRCGRLFRRPLRHLDEYIIRFFQFRLPLGHLGADIRERFHHFGLLVGG